MFPAPATSAQPRCRRSLFLSLSLLPAACSPRVEKKNRGRRGDGGSGDLGACCDGAAVTGRIEEGEKQRREGKRRDKEKEGDEEEAEKCEKKETGGITQERVQCVQGAGGGRGSTWSGVLRLCCEGWHVELRKIVARQRGRRRARRRCCASRGGRWGRCTWWS
ncbi:hypothetical protein AAC387_Pa06g1550 [Persea americana]